MPIQIDIAIEDEAWGHLDMGLKALCEKAIQSVEQSSNGELSFAFVDDAAIQKLNAEYRGKNKPTNVLSFPQEGMLLGDVILARETIAAEAKAQGKHLPDHLTHLIIHGFLHLLGYDHESEKEASIMEGLEIEALAKLGIDNPYQLNDSKT